LKTCYSAWARNLLSVVRQKAVNSLGNWYLNKWDKNKQRR
jgi:hypothetical protein